MSEKNASTPAFNVEKLENRKDELDILRIANRQGWENFQKRIDLLRERHEVKQIPDHLKIYPLTKGEAFEDDHLADRFNSRIETLPDIEYRPLDRDLPPAEEGANDPWYVKLFRMNNWFWGAVAFVCLLLYLYDKLFA